VEYRQDTQRELSPAGPTGSRGLSCTNLSQTPHGHTVTHTGDLNTTAWPVSGVAVMLISCSALTKLNIQSSSWTNALDPQGAGYFNELDIKYIHVMLNPAV